MPRAEAPREGGRAPPRGVIVPPRGVIARSADPGRDAGPALSLQAAAAGAALLPGSLNAEYTAVSPTVGGPRRAAAELGRDVLPTAILAPALPSDVLAPALTR